MFEDHDWHVCPEDYLWVRHEDGPVSRIGAERLQALLNGAIPRSEAERHVADNPAWLRIYLKHVIGEHCITIHCDDPLPDWRVAGC